MLDLVGSRFGWRDTLLCGLIVLLACGLFAVLVLARYHGEKEPQGQRRRNATRVAGIRPAAQIGLSPQPPFGGPAEADR